MAGSQHIHVLAGDQRVPPASPRLKAAEPAPMGRVMSFSARFDDVLAAAKHGSEWAWQQILGELGPAIQAYARSQGVSDPEDVLGQVLEGVVRGIDRFKGNETTFRSWVFTIAHSRVIDSRRKQGRRPQIADRDVPDVAGPEADAHDASHTLSRESALAMLDALPPKEREVVALRVVAGLSVEETARVLKKRPGAVRVAMHRGLQKLEAENLHADVTP